MIRGIVSRLGWAGVLVPLVAYGQPLPKEAHEASQRGMAAVEQQEWALAIKSFRDAQQIAPGDAATLFRLALAYDKGSCELPAIAAYRAYLASAPNAGNADVVRQRILALEVAVESKIHRLLRMAVESAEVLPDATEKSSVLCRIAEAYAELGDWDAATRTAAACTVSADRDSASCEISREQRWRGEFTLAAETAARIRDASIRAKAGLGIQRAAIEAKNLEACKQVCEWIPDVPIFDPDGHSQAFALANVAEMQAQDGDLDAARRTAAQIPADRRHKACAAAWMADAVAKRGDRDTAKELLLEARRAATALAPTYAQREDLASMAVLQAGLGEADEAARTAAAISPRCARPQVYFRIAKKQIEVGDKPAALASVAHGLDDAEQTTKESLDRHYSADMTLPNWRCWQFRDAVQLQLAAADSAAARETVDRALALAADQGVSPGNEHFLPDMAYEQARAGDLAGAHDTAARIPHEETRGFACYLIAEARARANDLDGARAALERISAGDRRHRAPAWLEMVKAQLDRRDPAGASQSAAQITEPAPLADAWQRIAAAQLKDGQTAAARDALDLAAKAAERIREEYSGQFGKSRLVRELAWLQERLGDSAGARRTAAQITDPEERLLALLQIGRSDGQTDRQLEEIRDWVRSLTADPRRRWTNLNDITSGSLESKLRAARQKSPREVVEAIIEAADELAGALDTVRELEAKWQKTRGS